MRSRYLVYGISPVWLVHLGFGKLVFLFHSKFLGHGCGSRPIHGALESMRLAPSTAVVLSVCNRNLQSQLTLLQLTF